ncbi:unnamed protein product [Fraxinus pennsylvanica]|uniref:Uncharacterized protein n=1 Tax=Fraxinus pennsylvanica TaxID=56036 RepID=A0AAD2EA89_9LAMI|nr:unnamed protein product [Fraxinus pennsylvanica]
MVAGKVKEVMGFQKSSSNQKQKPQISPKPPPSSMPTSGNHKGNGTVFSRSFGVYLPRASAQVQPRPPDISELLRLVEELRDRESRFKTELLEHKLLRDYVVPSYDLLKAVFFFHVIGGGEYTKENVARWWTVDTGILLDVELPDVCFVFTQLDHCEKAKLTPKSEVNNELDKAPQYSFSRKRKGDEGGQA